MKVPFNDLSRVFAAHEQVIMSKIYHAAKSGCWLNGNHNRHFSKQFSTFIGSDYCQLVGNGSDALEIALRSILEPTQTHDECEVIMVANAGGYATTACRLIGAIPRYVDVDEETLLLDFSSFEHCLSNKVKAIIVTHLYGGVVNIPKLRQILAINKQDSIPIIEDCAQAHGAKIGNQRVGSLGDIATFSFYPTKNLGAMGDGGAITTSNATLFQRLQKLHQYGWGDKYQAEMPFGRNSRMDEIQAAVLTCLLPFLDEYNEKRRSIYQRYREAAKHKICFLDYKQQDYVAHLVVIKTQRREKFINYMQSKGIAVGIHYPILDCDQPAWKNFPRQIDINECLPISRKINKEIVSLPCFPFMTDFEINHVCEALMHWEE